MRRNKFKSCFGTMVAVLLLFGTEGCRTSPAQRKSALIASAEKYSAAGEFGKAIIEYKNALKIEPESAELNYRLAQAYFANEQYDQAYLACQRAVEVRTGYVPALLLRGRIELDAKELAAASRSAQAILSQDPDNVDARILLADSYAGSNATEAVRILEKLVAEHPNLVTAHLDLGVFYISQGRLDAGRAEFENAVALDPKSIPARRDLANYYSSQNEMTKAEEQYKAAVALNPRSASADRALAEFYSAQRRWPDAEKAYQAYVNDTNNSPSARLALADFYNLEGRTDQAQLVLQELSRQAPSFTSAPLRLGDLALRRADYTEAARIANGILKDRPKEPDASILLARAKIGQNHASEAIPLLESAQRFEPNVPALHYWKGIAYREMGNLDMAQHSFEAAVALNDHDTDAEVALAGLMLERGLPDAAVRYAKLVLQQEPSRPEALLLAGDAQAGLRHFGEAESYFQQYTRLRPNDAQGPLRLGAVYAMERKYDAAERQFEASLVLDPKQIQALSDLVTLDQLRGENDKAVARVRKQIEHGETAALDDLLAATYMQLKQFQAAENVLKRSLQVDANNFRSYALLGALYETEHSVGRAIAEYQAAVKLNPQNAALMTALASLEEAAGQTHEAEQAYARVVDVTPGAVVASNNLAWLYCQNGGDLDKALDLALRARRLAPDQPSVADTLAWVYYKRNLYDSAMPLLEEAVRQEPAKAIYRVHLAANLLAVGQKQQARSELETAIHLDGGLRQDGDVRRILGNL